MLLPHTQVTFWTNPLTTGERTIIYYSLVIAGLALFAMLVKIWTSCSIAAATPEASMLRPASSIQSS